MGWIWHHGPALYGGEPCGGAQEDLQEFLERFVARVNSLNVGDGLDPATHMGP